MTADSQLKMIDVLKHRRHPEMMMLWRKFVKNCKLTAELGSEVEISIDYCHTILTENLIMRRVAAKFITQLLTLEQKVAYCPRRVF